MHLFYLVFSEAVHLEELAMKFPGSLISDQNHLYQMCHFFNKNNQLRKFSFHILGKNLLTFNFEALILVLENQPDLKNINIVLENYVNSIAEQPTLINNQQRFHNINSLILEIPWSNFVQDSFNQNQKIARNIHF